MDAASSVTQLLQGIRNGDKTAMDQLFPLVYSELRRLADSALKRERPGHTLQRTALVHEAYIRLMGGNQPRYEDRAHFLGIASRVMRQILVDYARRRNAGKRSAAMQVPLVEATSAVMERAPSMIELDDALSDLEKHDERKARLIEMRYFGGLTAEESGAVLEMPVPLVRRELRLAQAWLERELQRKADRRQSAASNS